jgi:diguanylate cyclase (GGDEF)-like protein
MSKPANILLVSEGPDRLGQWVRALSGPEMCLWQGTTALPPEPAVDVIVTDRDITCDLLPDNRSCSQLACGEIGIIRIGEESPADVCLAADHTGGELRLACLLLAQVVRLRRRCHRQERDQRVLRQLAMSDPLTGLPNRRAWEDRLAALAKYDGDSAGSGTGGICVAVLDLDHFKSINECAGHAGGDQVLRQVGQRLASPAGGVFAARLGGDEFGLLFGASDRRAATEAVERLRVDGCAETAPPVTASAGLAFGDLLTAPQALFQAADQALRRAKSEGRNRTVPP